MSLDHTAHQADLDDNFDEQDNYTVEKILAQRPSVWALGGAEFKVRWRGYAPSRDTWEPVSSFVPRMYTPFINYVRSDKTKIQVSDFEALSRAIEAKATDPRPELSPEWADRAPFFQVPGTSLACLLSGPPGAMSFQWSG